MVEKPILGLALALINIKHEGWNGELLKRISYGGFLSVRIQGQEH